MTTTVDKPKRKKSGGRIKGTPNAIAGELQAMVRASFSRVGGIEYLVRVAEENPVCYIGLISKLLPKQVEAKVTHDGEISHNLEIDWEAAVGADRNR